MHGGYSGMQAGGAVNRMKQLTGDFDCDVALMGHNHDTWVRPVMRMSYDRKKNQILEKTVFISIKIRLQQLPEWYQSILF